MITLKKLSTIRQKHQLQAPLFIKTINKQTEGPSGPCNYCALCGCHGKYNKSMVSIVSQILP